METEVVEWSEGHGFLFFFLFPPTPHPFTTIWCISTGNLTLRTWIRQCRMRASSKASHNALGWWELICDRLTFWFLFILSSPMFYSFTSPRLSLQI